MKDAALYEDIAQGPKSGAAYWVQSSDGIRLRIALWAEKSASNGTVFVFPGRAGYIERYGRISAALEKFGFASFVADWRGQGLSDRLTENLKVGHVLTYNDYQKDVAAIIDAAKQLDLPKPWFLMGTSMGACIGLRALTEGLDVAACAFNAPMWDIAMSRIQRLAVWPITWSAKTIGLSHLYAPGVTKEFEVLETSFENNDLTHDADMYDFWAQQARIAPELSIAGPSMGWVLESLKECKRLSKLGSPNLPCLTTYGDLDPVISKRAIEDRMKRWPGARTERIADAKHDVLSEVPLIRTKAVTDICEFFLSAGH